MFIVYELNYEETSSNMIIETEKKQVLVCIRYKMAPYHGRLLINHTIIVGNVCKVKIYDCVFTL